MKATMKTYTGTKLISAQPMTRAEYNTYRGWELPTNENGADEGYLVEYTDGGTPNDSRHAGYISWSPKAQFDKAYIELPEGANQLQPWQQRVVAEHAELDAKGVKLFDFITSESDAYNKLDDQDKHLMAVQVTAMAHYSVALENRIARFTQTQ